MKFLRPFFLLTDIGFILYWGIALFNLLPENMLYKDYNNPIMISWNWSFFPLDMFVSATGLASLYFYSKKNGNVWKKLCLISLILTFCSGLQAISFWTLRGDFDIFWWAMNLYLIIYPAFFIVKLFNDSLE